MERCPLRAWGVTVCEFHQNASKVLAAAGRGERITVTKNGRPMRSCTSATFVT
ncbi:type II toxin-antitoxin system prevent-host-death family antitoxin [Streptomyces sp. NPDC050388]|uniref:type II toxin-antitoxin system Phd/YefM family antitoxin n=1 Tax=Streptomyces sp. NPDC050388 TaxID=3155781 RepID=UPI00342EE7B7